MQYNYENLKQLAKTSGLKVNDLVALSPTNDPFYTGRPSELRDAQWFTDLWHQFNLQHEREVHLRRVHYQIVGQGENVVRLPTTLSYRPDPKNRPKHRVHIDYYENRQVCWDFLVNAGKFARYMNMVNPQAFADKRNHEPSINAWFHKEGDWNWEDPTPSYEVYGEWTDEEFRTPQLPGLDDLPEIPMLPFFEVSGYDVQQGHLIEIWCEKSTMTDVLLPICRRYNANYVTGLGELSITSVVEFLKRVRSADRPAHILYISDFDPAGMGMPISIARKIEYFLREEADTYGEQDVWLHPIVLTKEQVAQYSLPRVPVKDSDLRKGNFEAAYGKGQVELDALQALYPGELAKIVTAEVDKWYDPELPSRASVAKRSLERMMEEKRDEIVRDDYQDQLDDIEEEYNDAVGEWAEIQQKVDELVSRLAEQRDEVVEQMADIEMRGRQIYTEIYNDLKDVDIDPEDDEATALPEPDIDGDEPDAVLYNSERDYFDQLKYYKAQRHGTNGDTQDITFLQGELL